MFDLNEGIAISKHNSFAIKYIAIPYYSSVAVNVTLKVVSVATSIVILQLQSMHVHTKSSDSRVFYN